MALSDALFHATGHSFRDTELMQRALTHSSARGQADDNERLEFLGDRVLGLIVSEMLYKRFPTANQGELALRLNAMVSGESCGAVALEMGLDTMIRADAVARGTRGRKVSNALADAVEALIAAVYLDGGIEATRSLVSRYWDKRAEAGAGT
ncbi:MAG TPA: ribonuclease III domain-containing protein, partial [Rhabdaerophilum sp.]|nr:ribonuclease III domain-containing protein [Rhabdaerophilum sp.]